ncbi:hypothetical protein LINPERHAP1_LOCUS26436 [Linum perenne]
MVIRDDVDDFISCKTLWRSGRPEVKEGEALALLEAMQWVEQSEYDRMVFEVDALLVRQAVYSEEKDLIEFGMIIKKCKDILRSRPSFEVVAVGRDRNKVARKLAQ